MDINELERDILTEIDAKTNVYIELLQALVRSPSPQPPGNTVEIAQVVRDFLTQRKIHVDTIAPQSHMPNLVTSFDGGKGLGQRVIYNGHMDTFPTSNPEEWKRGLYSGERDEDRIYGLGSVDMKAGTAASIIAFTLLRARKEHLKGSVTLTAVSDEESGGRWGSRYLLDEFGDKFRGDVVVNGEPGGLTSVRFGEKGTLRITFTVQTRGGNGAYQHRSRGANIVATQLIVRLLEIETMKPDLPADVVDYLTSKKAREAANEIMGEGADEIILNPTVNIGVINGGAKVNTIPEKCVFEADIRLPIGMVAETVIARIHSILHDFSGISFEIQKAASNPANYGDLKHPLAQLMQKTAASVTGREPVMLVGIGGTDCKFWRYQGVPAFVFGVSPEGMGSTDESVRISEFLAVVKVHTLAVLRYLFVETG